MPKRLKRIAIRTILGLSVLLITGLAVGFVDELRRERHLTRQYEPPGEMIDIGSHRLHLYCEGSGEPPVLLEAGSSLAFVNWDTVQSGLSRVTRVCSYDRSGLGWSEMGPTPPSALQATDELARLLDASGIDGPWIVVGHSLGGLYAQHFLNRFPQLVAGLVLLDSTGDDMFERLPAWRELFTPGPLESLSPLLSLVGLHRLSRPSVPESDPSWVARELHATSKHVRRGAAEWWSIPTSAEQVLRARTDWGDTPVLVVDAGGGQLPGSWSDETKLAARQTKAERRVELANRSSRGGGYVLEESGHGIPWEQPQAVITALDSMVQLLRRER